MNYIGMVITVLAPEFGNSWGSSHGRVKPQIIILVFVAFPFSTKQLGDKNKDWLTRNQNNVSEWCDMSIPAGCYFNELALKIQLSVLA